MSLETKKALDEAIAAHIMDETNGDLVTSYLLTIATLNADNLENDTSNYFHEFSDQQPFHISVGLANLTTMRLMKNYNSW